MDLFPAYKIELDPNAKEFVPASSRSRGGGSNLAPPVSLSQKKTAAARIQADWSQPAHWPSEAEIKRAALLAWEGHLTSVECMRIVDRSIRDIPWGHMEKLASIVTEKVTISNMTHTDQLSSILANIKCQLFWLRRMDLSDTETWALVTAMRDRVGLVILDEDVTLDIEQLTQYNGQGCCIGLGLCCDTRTRHGERLRRWVASKRWTVTRDDDMMMICVTWHMDEEMRDNMRNI